MVFHGFTFREYWRTQFDTLQAECAILRSETQPLQFAAEKRVVDELKTQASKHQRLCRAVI